MKYLLDTNIIVGLLRKKMLVNTELLEAGSAISIITKAELFYGAYKSANTNDNLKLIENLIKDFELETIYLENKSVNIFGEIKAELENKGERLEDFDVLIAATALASDLTLVTRNIKHFERIKQLKLLKS